jgi:hypothetical protein
MRPASASPGTRAPSETTVTTITKETSTQEKQPLPEFWSYIEALKPEDWHNHICYIYRMDPRQQMDYGSGTGSTALEKVVGTLEIRPGVSIPFNDREEIELGIREKYGGKTFRLFLKRGSERICETRITNEYPPKYPAAGAMSGTPQGNSPVVLPATDASNTADVARTAINTLAGQDARMTDVAVRALTGAAEVVTRMAATDRASSPMDQAFQAVMVRMLERSMDPPDPTRELERIANLVKILNPGGAPAATSNPMMERIMDAALERILNPATVAGPVATASAELVRALPTVATYIVEGIREWRVGAEAQRDTAAIMNGAPPRNAPSPTPAPPPRAPQALPTTTQPPQGAGTVITIEFLESKMIEIFNEGAPAEDAADDFLTFLDRLAPEVITQLKSQGEAGLLNLFQTREILRPAINNMPRLREFIKAFLQLAGNQKPQAPPPAGPIGTAKA